MQPCDTRNAKCFTSTITVRITCLSPNSPPFNRGAEHESKAVVAVSYLRCSPSAQLVRVRQIGLCGRRHSGIALHPSRCDSAVSRNVEVSQRDSLTLHCARWRDRD